MKQTNSKPTLSMKLKNKPTLNMTLKKTQTRSIPVNTIAKKGGKKYA